MSPSQVDVVEQDRQSLVETVLEYTKNSLAKEVIESAAKDIGLDLSQLHQWTPKQLVKLLETAVWYADILEYHYAVYENDYEMCSNYYDLACELWQDVELYREYLEG